MFKTIFWKDIVIRQWRLLQWWRWQQIVVGRGWWIFLGGIKWVIKFLRWLASLRRWWGRIETIIKSAIEYWDYLRGSTRWFHCMGLSPRWGITSINLHFFNISRKFKIYFECVYEEKIERSIAIKYTKALHLG